MASVETLWIHYPWRDYLYPKDFILVKAYKQQYSSNSCHKLLLSTSMEVEAIALAEIFWKEKVDPKSYSKTSHLWTQKFEQVTKKKEGAATRDMATIQIHAINAEICYRELLNQKVAILANRESFIKNILQGALGMRNMFALFNQNFPVTAEAIQWTWVSVTRKALTEKFFLLPWWSEIPEDFLFCTGTSNFCPYFLQMSTLDWNISDQGSKSKTLPLCFLYLQWVPWSLLY